MGRLGTGVGNWCQARATPLIWVGQVFLVGSTHILPGPREPGPGLLPGGRARVPGRLPGLGLLSLFHDQPSACPHTGNDSCSVVGEWMSESLECYFLGPRRAPSPPHQASDQPLDLGLREHREPRKVPSSGFWAAAAQVPGLGFC